MRANGSVYMAIVQNETEEAIKGPCAHVCGNTTMILLQIQKEGLVILDQVLMIPPSGINI